MIEKIQLINTFFTNIDKRIHLTKSFVLGDSNIIGEILLETEKDNLLFTVQIPFGYPLGQGKHSIIFTCNQISGYEHQNLDNSICLHPQPNENIEFKLKSEVDLLFEWVQEYYIEEKVEVHYNYLLHHQEAFCMFFDNSIKKLDKGTSGTFEYTLHSKNALYQNFIVLSLNKIRFSWSDTMFDRKPILNGYWIFIENEPIIEHRKIANIWNDLSKFLSSENILNLYRFQQSQYKKADYFFLLLGYYIPVNNEKEIHWELIKIPINQKISEGIKVQKGLGWQSYLTDEKIIWCKSANIDYTRFFGRGKLNKMLGNAKILIIGVGAIGSSLSKILVRGGARHLTLCDIDFVAVGNICRSEYYLEQHGVPKIYALGQLLIGISPFVNLDFIVEIEKVVKSTKNYNKIKEELNKFDIIFDCSTDMEIAYMLDNMYLQSDIYNLSITNQANEFVCIFGGNNIAKKKNQIFNELNHNDIDLDFYPEVGCGYPTFKANYNDINTLLNYAINQLNHRYEIEVPQCSFILRTIKNELDFKIEFNEY